MSNMSYCRFHNTALDLDDCRDALEEMSGNIHLIDRYNQLVAEWKERNDSDKELTEDEEYELDELHEELDRLRDEIKPLSESEYRKAKWLLELCAEIAEAYDESILISEDQLENHHAY